MLLTSNFAFAESFDWTYGGGTDPVFASGILDATPDASVAGAYDIVDGSGTRTDSTGTYAVTIVPFSASNDPAQCSYSPSSNCTVVASGGVSADLIFDNLLYPANPAGSQLDGDGIVLNEPAGLDAQFYAVWSDGSADYVGPPDQEFDPYYYTSTNLANPFVVTQSGISGDTASTPEPATFGLIGLGLAGMAFAVLKKTTARDFPDRRDRHYSAKRETHRFPSSFTNSAA
jgi:hypothetical protein